MIDNHITNKRWKLGIIKNEDDAKSPSTSPTQEDPTSIVNTYGSVDAGFFLRGGRFIGCPLSIILIVLPIGVLLYGLYAVSRGGLNYEIGYIQGTLRLIIAVAIFIYVPLLPFRMALLLRAIAYDKNDEDDVSSSPFTEVGEGPLPQERIEETEQYIRDKKLRYQVMVAVYREAGIMKRLIRNLDLLKYPREHIDLMILVEKGEDEDIAAEKQRAIHPETQAPKKRTLIQWILQILGAGTRAILYPFIPATVLRWFTTRQSAIFFGNANEHKSTEVKPDEEPITTYQAAVCAVMDIYPPENRTKFVVSRVRKPAYVQHLRRNEPQTKPRALNYGLYSKLDDSVRFKKLIEIAEDDWYEFLYHLEIAALVSKLYKDPAIADYKVQLSDAEQARLKNHYPNYCTYLTVYFESVYKSNKSDTFLEVQAFKNSLVLTTIVDHIETPKLQDYDLKELSQAEGGRKEDIVLKKRLLFQQVSEHLASMYEKQPHFAKLVTCMYGRDVLSEHDTQNNGSENAVPFAVHYALAGLLFDAQAARVAWLSIEKSIRAYRLATQEFVVKALQSESDTLDDILTLAENILDHEKLPEILKKVTEPRYHTKRASADVSDDDEQGAEHAHKLMQDSLNNIVLPTQRSYTASLAEDDDERPTYCVVYDAEDRPEEDQLLKAVREFQIMQLAEGAELEHLHRIIAAYCTFVKKGQDNDIHDKRLTLLKSLSELCKQSLRVKQFINSVTNTANGDAYTASLPQDLDTLTKRKCEALLDPLMKINPHVWDNTEALLKILEDVHKDLHENEDEFEPERLQKLYKELFEIKVEKANVPRSGRAKKAVSKFLAMSERDIPFGMVWSPPDDTDMQIKGLITQIKEVLHYDLRRQIEHFPDQKRLAAFFTPLMDERFLRRFRNWHMDNLFTRVSDDPGIPYLKEMGDVPLEAWRAMNAFFEDIREKDAIGSRQYYTYKDGSGLRKAIELPQNPMAAQALQAFITYRREPICLQAKLTYENLNDSWIIALFKADYSSWFNYLLPGLHAFNLPIPLGGTSNHFKRDALAEIGGWDAYNVAEDCDLGIWIARHNKGVRVLKSITWEIADSDIVKWVNQRSRWMKGYAQSFFVHIRQPFVLLQDLGWWRTMGFLFTVGAGFLLPMLSLLFYSMTIYYLVSVVVLLIAGIGSDVTLVDTLRYSLRYIYDIHYYWVLPLGTGSFFVSNVIYFLILVIGQLRHPKPGKSSYVIVWWWLYWLIMIFAALKAFVEYVFNPFYWEKSNHDYV